ncbi:TRAP transporter small permease [Pseudahrensia aquimaris]|uniref:TRAP transporter small permease protein n=1 Tax=Pseudahrensia aquimaris TaxID=744461 RepID=A0ABW3FF49_9HYPH
MEKIDSWVDKLAVAMALLGGFVLIGIIVATCLSITGRELAVLGLGPISGDYEIVEIGTAFAVFSFLPLCTLRRAHATVDLMMPALGKWGNRISDLLVSVLMAVLSIVIAWRLFVGMGEKRLYLETTFILQFPVWIAYAICMAGALVFVVVALWSLVRTVSGGGSRV